MATTGLVVLVPEAETCVQALRARFDATSHLGVPAHVTVLFPFMSPELITASVRSGIESAIAPMATFSFELTRIGRFPATTYLAPEPAQPFIAMTQALVRKFPAFPPFGGIHASIVPHLTVANGNAADAEIAAAELVPILRTHGPVRSLCTSVTLLENSTGVWRRLDSFDLGT